MNIAKLNRAIVARVEALELASIDNVRAIRREVSTQIEPLAANHVIQLALLLLESDAFNPRFFAYELVHYHHAALKSLNSRNIMRLGKGINSWAAVDTFACYLSGPAWREGQIPDSVITSWTRSNDRWWRRAAVVSTVALNNKARGGRGDAKRTISVCGRVVGDHDDMVVKALSWALRELSKREPSVVNGFILEHESQIHPRVLREVRNKLKTGLKNPTGRRGK
jgi:3-methyladenine DNA glycosylase AlkD